MEDKRRTYTSQAFIFAILILLFIPMIQRKGNLRQFYYDNWGNNDVKWIFNRIRFALGDTTFGSGLIVNKSWGVYTLEKSLDDYQGIDLLSENDFKIIQQKLDQVNDVFKARGIKLLVVIPPSKNTIYPENVPNFVPKIGDRSNLDLFMDYMKTNGRTEIIDLRPVLMQEKQKHPVFYATDTHWNPYGAYAGYQEIMKAIRNSYDNVPVVPMSDLRYEQTEFGNGNLFAGLGINAKIEPIFELVPDEKWKGEIISWGFHHLYSKNLDGKLRVAVYHDSFTDSLIPFFSESFREAHYYLDRSYKIDSKWIRDWEPDLVIIEFTELYIQNLKSFQLLTP